MRCRAPIAGLVLLIALALPAALHAAPKQISKSFVLKISGAQLRFSVQVPGIFDRDLWDKLESGISKPILYRFQLVASDDEVVVEFFLRLTVRYDPLAQIPFFELSPANSKRLLIKTKKLLVQRLSSFPFDPKGLLTFPSSLLSAVKRDRYRLRILIWVNPWTDEQLKRLNKLFRPLGQFNILKMRLFDNSKFRPQREFEILSQPFLFPKRT